jgi:hypothetical protein
MRQHPCAGQHQVEPGDDRQILDVRQLCDQWSSSKTGFAKRACLVYMLLGSHITAQIMLYIVIQQSGCTCAPQHLLGVLRHVTVCGSVITAV